MPKKHTNCYILLDACTKANEIACQDLYAAFSMEIHTIFTLLRYAGNSSACKSVGILETCRNHFIIQIFSLTLGFLVCGPTLILFYLLFVVHGVLDLILRLALTK